MNEISNTQRSWIRITLALIFIALAQMSVVADEPSDHPNCPTPGHCMRVGGLPGVVAPRQSGNWQNFSLPSIQYATGGRGFGDADIHWSQITDWVLGEARTHLNPTVNNTHAVCAWVDNFSVGGISAGSHTPPCANLQPDTSTYAQVQSWATCWTQLHVVTSHSIHRPGYKYNWSAQDTESKRECN
jgi:hypothetical protein